MNQILSAVSLDDQSGLCANFSQMRVLGVVMKSAPAGTLTMTGVTQSNGQPL
jgi:hypothetical protein